MIACDVLAAFLALFWLKPVAAKTIAKSEAMAGATPISEGKANSR